MSRQVYLIEPKYRLFRNISASVRYRAYHINQFSPLNDVRISYLDESEQLHGSDRVIFIRPKISNNFLMQYERVKHLGCEVIADFDDLIFCPEIAAQKPACINGISSVKSVVARSEEYLQALKMFDQITVSTRTLSEQVKIVHPNAIVDVSRNYLALFGKAFVELPLECDGRSEIHYFSGTNSHQDDLELISSVLEKWLLRDPNRQLVLRGSIRIPDKLKPLNVRVEPACHYLAMGENLQQAIACIAPLRDTAFNRCKSAIKFLESAQYGMPVVASNVGEYVELEQEVGAGPLLARCEQDWLRYLERLSADTDFWQEESRKQYQAAMAYGYTD